jgi:transcriptional regulator with GAF, ATPase, and Fis domain
VRELQNIIERAVITSPGPHLNLNRALPDAGALPQRPSPETAAAPDILTEDELNELQRRNMLQALEAADWQISGQCGAARRLGLKPSTLQSRMKSFGIKRPATT